VISGTKKAPILGLFLSIPSELEFFDEVADRAGDIDSTRSSPLAVFHPLHDTRRLRALGAVGALLCVHDLLTVAGLGNLCHNLALPKYECLVRAPKCLMLSRGIRELLRIVRGLSRPESEEKNCGRYSLGFYTIFSTQLEATPEESGKRSRFLRFSVCKTRAPIFPGVSGLSSRPRLSWRVLRIGSSGLGLLLRIRTAGLLWIGIAGSLRIG
jgi:hypothetical protein